VFDDDNDQYGFWSDEPTRALDRIGARRKPAGPAPTAPARRQRPSDPQVGRRRHSNVADTNDANDAHDTHDTHQRNDTQQIPVVAGLRQSIGHVDPLIRRVAALAIVVALGVPLAMTLRGGDERSSLQPDTSTVAVGQTVAPSAAAAATELATDPAATEAAVVQATAPEAAVTATAAPPATDAPVVEAEVSNVVAATPVAAPPAVEAVAVVATELVCAKEYEVVAGDYWILIAKKVSLSLDEVLTANNATTKTAIYPGRTVCLPSNASAPTTVAPATTAAPATAPATTAKPVTAPPTTVKAPTTTVKPTTTSTPAAAAPKASYGRSEVEAIIRQVWPDDLEDEAVRIATRESNLSPGVRNYCCFGLFQIYFSVHKVWLGQMGVTSAEQLYDPMTNAYVAYAMYLKAGGWGPWRL